MLVLQLGPAVGGCMQTEPPIIEAINKVYRPRSDDIRRRAAAGAAAA